ncbi:peroxisomal membrane protein PEX13 isoform X2 [Ceratina calcarata]|uniref:Peroxisomal membrane protein PEX13 n=1 Tax=Ceratina calcarata TaxID=156304 RepID=A0AAJ7JCJ8_9HYME|nr:peroxisomal membrane protein PEX13 isoform X2 [Ceratina calcarata]
MALERTNGNSSGNYLRNVPNINQLTSIPNGPPTTPYPSIAYQSGQNPPPPVPPRQPALQNNYWGYNSSWSGPNHYGGYGGGFGHGSQYRGFGGSGGYSSWYSPPYLGYNGNNNNYGPLSTHSGNAENRFFHYIEANVRPTFQSIETVVHTFSSMTMLLESTYLALTNSFRAILSVAESVGKLRSTINQLFSTFAMIRFVKWLYRKIVRTAGLGSQGSRRFDSTDEELWEKSLAKMGNDRNAKNSSFWSGLLTFTVFIAIPYMIHKIASSVRAAEAEAEAGSVVADPKTWYESEEPTHVATVLYDFAAVNNDELSVKAGQKICLAPKSLQPKQTPGWCRATDNTNVGLVPYNYIKILGQLKRVKRSDDDATAGSPAAAAARDEAKSRTNGNPSSKQQQDSKTGLETGETDDRSSDRSSSEKGGK